MSLRLKILGEGYTFVPKKWELQKGRFQLNIRSFPVSYSCPQVTRAALGERELFTSRLVRVMSSEIALGDF